MLLSVNVISSPLETFNNFASLSEITIPSSCNSIFSCDFLSASELGADTFICGDLREDVVRAAEEQGINVIAAGHYNTEKLGIQNLGK